MLKELALKHKPDKKPYELAIYLDAYERAKKKNESRLLDEIELKIKSLHCYPSICFLESN